MKNSQKGVALPLLFAVIALLLAGGGVYAHRHNKQANQVSSEDLTTRVTSTAQTSDSQTTNWKTYTNTKFHYSIAYPDNFTISFQPEYTPFPSDQSTTFNLRLRGSESDGINIFGVANISAVCHTATMHLEKQGSIKVDGVEAQKYILHATDNGDTRSSYDYLFQKNYDDTCFVISLEPYPADASVEKIFDEIVSTFKFSQ